MSENKESGWFNEGVHILPPPLEIIKGIGHYIKEFCTMHQLSERSDHFVPFQEIDQWKPPEN